MIAFFRVVAVATTFAERFGARFTGFFAFAFDVAVFVEFALAIADDIGGLFGIRDEIGIGFA